MTKPLRCLVVEDVEDDALLVLRELRAGGCDVTAERVETAEAMQAALARQPWDFVISDYKMPRFSGTAALELLKASGLDLPFIIVSGTIGEDTAVEAMRLGANDYFMKGRLARLAAAVKRELINAATRRAHRQAEADLKGEQALLTGLISTIPDHIYFKDRQSRFVRISEAMAKRFGWGDSAEAVGKTDFDVFSEEHARQAYTDEQRIMETGEPMIGYEEKETWPDGHVTWVSTTKVPSRGADGQVTGLIGVSRDITEHKLLEEKFFHAQRLESLGMMAAGISHDLNNILSPIMFAAPMLRESLSAPRDLKILDTLSQSANRGAALVKQILAFVHSTTGDFRITQVKHILRDISDVMAETFPKSIQLEQQIPSDLWPVQGNPTLIHQIFLNLCVNARDAMPQGGTLRLVAANRRIEAGAVAAIPGARPGDWLVIEVSDTGTGIPPEVLEQIWTPFFTTKGVGKGTGLGLSTVRSIVASHHGYVELDTAVGRGSTFRVFLPASESDLPRPGTMPPAKNFTSCGELILVVDDDDGVRELITDILRHQGYLVTSCVDGMEALTVLAARVNEFSLIITDVDMPRLGGLALTRSLLQLFPDIRVLAISGMSARTTSESDIPAMKELAHAFLSKPFKAEDLLAAVHQMLHPPGKADPP